MPALPGNILRGAGHDAGEGFAVWIFDTHYQDCMELWGRERGLTRSSIAYPH